MGGGERGGVQLKLLSVLILSARLSQSLTNCWRPRTNTRTIMKTHTTTVARRKERRVQHINKKQEWSGLRVSGLPSQTGTHV